MNNASFLHALVGSMSQGAAGNPTVAMIEAAFAHHGLHWRYINMEVTPEELAAAIRGARAMGFRGFNCSICFNSTRYISWLFIYRVSIYINTYWLLNYRIY